MGPQVLSVAPFACSPTRWHYLARVVSMYPVYYVVLLQVGPKKAREIWFLARQQRRGGT